MNGRFSGIGTFYVRVWRCLTLQCFSYYTKYGDFQLNILLLYSFIQHTFVKGLLMHARHNSWDLKNNCKIKVSSFKELTVQKRGGGKLT